MPAIGIDLDDTLITSFPTAYGVEWRIKPSAVKYLPKIAHELGYELHLITARPQLISWREVRAIVASIEEQLGVRFKSIQHSDYGPKGYHASMANCDFMVDDCLHYLSTCNEHEPAAFPLLFGTRKQRVADKAGFPCLACESWREVYLHLLAKNAQGQK